MSDNDSVASVDVQPEAVPGPLEVARSAESRVRELPTDLSALAFVLGVVAVLSVMALVYDLPRFLSDTDAGMTRVRLFATLGLFVLAGFGAVGAAVVIGVRAHVRSTLAIREADRAWAAAGQDRPPYRF